MTVVSWQPVRRFLWPARWRPALAAAPLALPGCRSQPKEWSLPRPTRFKSSRSTAFLPATRPHSSRLAGVIPYDINSALFSDYAEKFRFIKLPAGTSATYKSDAVFDLPVGPSSPRRLPIRTMPRNPSAGPPADRNADLEARARRLGRAALRLERGTIRGHARRGR